MRRAVGGAFVALLAGIAACQGDNLFAPHAPGAGGQPTVHILEPAGTVPLHTNVLVSAEVSAPAGIKSVSFRGVAFRGDSLSDVTEMDRFSPATASYPRLPNEALPVQDTVTRELLADTSTVTEPVFFIVTVTDSAGRSGADTLQALVGGPRVGIELPLESTPVVAGGSIPIRVTAVDSLRGLDSLRVSLSGVMSMTLTWRGYASAALVTEDTTIVAGMTVGDVVVSATVWSDTLPGTAAPRRIHLVAPSAGDTLRPRLSVRIAQPAMSPAPRLELGDTLVFVVTAADSGTAGLARVGLIARVLNADTATVVPVYRSRSYPGDPSSVDTFRVTLADFGLRPEHLPLPLGVKLTVSAFAEDLAAPTNRGCASHEAPESQDCVADPDNPAFFLPEPAVPQWSIVPVSGMTVLLPGGGVIGDAVVDTARQRLFLSNVQKNRVELLSLSSMTFRSGGIAVGSRPWGLFIGGFDPLTGEARSDTLIVANSGGTNISYIGLAGSDPDGLAEDTQKRLLTPNALLWIAERKTDNTGAPVFVVDPPIQFSDRPQFVAQDSLGRIVYSTVPTPAAPNGTIRVADSDPAPSVSGDTVEVVIFTRYAPFTPAAGHVSIERVDSVLSAGAGPLGPLLAIFDHRVGFPGQRGYAIVDPYRLDVDSLNAANGWDVGLYVDVDWNLDALALHDTTFIAASGDRGEIAVGEGAASPYGRIMVYRAADRGISDAVATSDLIGNVSERVNGLALNRDGALGAARGTQGAYYFTGQQQSPGELRLQGVFEGDLGADGAGAALHPDHTGVIAATGSSYSFIGTDRSTVKIIDTVHFLEVGEIAIRDDIVGPLRATRALPADNAGLAPGSSNYVIAKLYGVTSAGGVVVVNIRIRDIN